MSTIGVAVPTRNRALLLREALICLRDQTYADFKVLVLDNASTDETPQVFKDVVGCDPRFDYHRHESMLPMADNFFYGLNSLKTEYFMWRADDDLSSDNYIELLYELLETQPEADLAITPVERWHTVAETRSLVPLSSFTSTDKIDRTIHLLRNKRPTWIYGLWRRAALRHNATLIGDRYPYLWAWEHLLMMPTVLTGRVTIARDALFTQRILGRGSYELAPAERLKARAIYAGICAELLQSVNVPPTRLNELQAVLEFHFDDRVGPLKWLRRKAFRDKVRMALGLKQE